MTLQALHPLRRRFVSPLGGGNGGAELPQAAALLRRQEARCEITPLPAQHVVEPLSKAAAVPTDVAADDGLLDRLPRIAALAHRRAQPVEDLDLIGGDAACDSAEQHRDRVVRRGIPLDDLLQPLAGHVAGIARRRTACARNSPRASRIASAGPVSPI